MPKFKKTKSREKDEANLPERALGYHCLGGKPGKISIRPTKPCKSSYDLGLAYTPGVAEPVIRIEKSPDDAYHYTDKGNLVAVISNGTAILGLGDRGALASKPVMEGKAVLFKKFADIDVFDLEINESDPKRFVQIVKSLCPTFGGINLEDIKAPECFEIERRLVEECDIPVMHDDQHGTAIIVTAGLMNACEITNRRLSDVKLVVNGAGAAGLSCVKMALNAGVKRENVIMLDSHGVISAEREDLSEEKRQFAVSGMGGCTLADAIKDADVFFGLSKGDVLSAEMLKTMAADPIVFAMANPNPEIKYDLAVKTRKDVIMCTGRSNHPNQINNVLCFPYIFRGALDVRASRITEGMKMAAAMSLAELAKKHVPLSVRRAYNSLNISFGRNYIVPKPFDPRVIEYESVAVAKAAMEEGVAGRGIQDWDGYRHDLKKRIKVRHIMLL